MVDGVPDEDYWVEVSQGGRRLGAGFLLTRCHALTALHCLRAADPELGGLDVTFAGGETVPGRIYRRSPEADLALIDIEIPESVDFPSLLLPDRAADNETWHNPYRPSLSHAFLSGNITKVSTRYKCAGGDVIEAIQLGCAQPVGDYAGYSGSPIERSEPPERRRLLGILLEQYPEQFGNYWESQRASTVLFAATMDEVFRRFKNFGADHLIMGVVPSSNETVTEFLPSYQGGSAARVADDQFVRAESLFRFFDEMKESKNLEGIDVTVLKMDVLNKLISNVMNDPGP